MTDDALRALRDAVKAGEWITVEMVEVACAKHGTLIMAAYDGSLDAAHALHKAVLPGWAWSVFGMGQAVVSPQGNARVTYYGGASDPSRAWLLAILEALIAQQGAGKGGE